MQKLFVIVIDDNVVRPPLTELAERAGATMWLVTSPRYAERLSPEHLAAFADVRVLEDLDVASIAAAIEPRLTRDTPAALRFLTLDESCELTCAGLSERFGVPGWPVDQVAPFINKAVCKDRLAGSDVAVPQHVVFDRAAAARDGGGYCAQLVATVGLPMIAKPVDRFASMYVGRLDTMMDLRTWALRTALRDDGITYEVERFITGTLYNCDSLVRDSTVLWSAVCRNAHPCMEFAAGRSLGVAMLPDDDPIVDRIKELSARALAVLGPPDGAIHMEIFHTDDDQLVFLEAGARPPGGRLTEIYQRCLGFNLEVAHYLLRAREPYEVRVSATGELGAWYILPRRAGTVTRLDPPELSGEHEITYLIAPGDVITHSSRNIVEPPAAVTMLYHHDAAVFADDLEALRTNQFYEVRSL